MFVRKFAYKFEPTPRCAGAGAYPETLESVRRRVALRHAYAKKEFQIKRVTFSLPPDNWPCTKKVQPADKECSRKVLPECVNA